MTSLAASCSSLLLVQVEVWLVERGVRFPQGKTVAAMSASPDYAGRGFTPPEILPILCDARNPALQCIEVLKQS